ncbi:MAG: hypothetical protein OJF52_000188 [Nitrospira sp.]|nr:MAG: hypothetical protein OJF52_000188 [Nitrospira sp.]
MQCGDQVHIGDRQQPAPEIPLAIVTIARLRYRVLRGSGLAV